MIFTRSDGFSRPKEIARRRGHDDTTMGWRARYGINHTRGRRKTGTATIQVHGRSSSRGFSFVRLSSARTLSRPSLHRRLTSRANARCDSRRFLRSESPLPCPETTTTCGVLVYSAEFCRLCSSIVPALRFAGPESNHIGRGPRCTKRRHYTFHTVTFLRHDFKNNNSDNDMMCVRGP